MGIREKIIGGGAVAVRLDVVQHAAPAIDPISRVGMVLPGAGALQVGDFKDDEGVHRPRDLIELPVARLPYLLDDVWASSVDLFWIAVLFWSLSGLWLWWELKTTRRLGALFLSGGLAVFGLFLAVL